jgi:hypothetical protein
MHCQDKAWDFCPWWGAIIVEELEQKDHDALAQCCRRSSLAIKVTLVRSRVLPVEQKNVPAGGGIAAKNVRCSMTPS